ncbi:MAG TPA: hypothetical protein VK752_07835 [Bryobacteraceae bacterium]|jgi:hypothetical protein|nr:hypothetical protein [Bryobacteraceae bacterium]
MRVATNVTFAADKKEPLSELLGRIRQAFLDAGMGEPAIRFTMVDSSVKKGVPIDRVLKRYPEMERFVGFDPIIPGSPTKSRLLSNHATGEAVEYATLQAILAGVPRTYGFAGLWLHFHTPMFGERLIGLPRFGNSLPGVVVTDSWWVTGRKRALSVYTTVEVEMEDKKLPPNPEPIEALIKALGKVKRTDQVSIRAPGGGIVGSIAPANVEAVKAIFADYKARLKEIVDLADLPHNLPPAAEIRQQSAGVTAGPRKPALEAAFKPMGYSCRGGSGTFYLTRRTAGNLTVELYLDVGTWSHSISAMVTIKGGGFQFSLNIPVAPNEAPGQYPIGDAIQWQKIVENLAAMVRELDRSFVPEIEQAAGPSPAWYKSAL